MIVALGSVLIVSSLLMIVLVLLHKGKGGGLSDMFGGGVSSSLGGSSVAERNLDRLTIVIGLVWLACIVALGPAPQAHSRHSTRGTAMAGGSAIRGSRVGAGPMGEAERGEAAPRHRVSFWCANGHETRPSFADDAAIPEAWDCPRCGCRRARDKDNPPAPPRTEPYKTHLAYVKERRSDNDGEAILAEALAKLRGDA